MMINTRVPVSAQVKCDCVSGRKCMLESPDQIIIKSTLIETIYNTFISVFNELFNTINQYLC